MSVCVCYMAYVRVRDCVYVNVFIQWPLKNGKQKCVCVCFVWKMCVAAAAVLVHVNIQHKIVRIASNCVKITITSYQKKKEKKKEINLFDYCLDDILKDCIVYLNFCGNIYSNSILITNAINDSFKQA